VPSPSAATLPTPESHFGHPIGVDRELLDWSEVVTYFQALEKASDRIRVKQFGLTPQGHTFIVSTITSRENMRNVFSVSQKTTDRRPRENSFGHTPPSVWTYR
jgi:hypothetical protein